MCEQTTGALSRWQSSPLLESAERVGRRCHLRKYLNDCGVMGHDSDHIEIKPCALARVGAPSERKQRPPSALAKEVPDVPDPPRSPEVSAASSSRHRRPSSCPD